MYALTCGYFDGGRPARTDHRVPYRIVYRLNFPAGARHVAEARVTYRLNGRARRTSVGRAMAVIGARDFRVERCRVPHY